MCITSCLDVSLFPVPISKPNNLICGATFLHKGTVQWCCSPSPPPAQSTTKRWRTKPLLFFEMCSRFELGLSTRDPNDCTVWCTENRWANGTRCTWIALFTKSKNKIFLWSKLEKLHGHSECEWVQSKLMRIMGNKSLPVGKKSLIILMGSLWKRRHLVINYHYCAFTVNSTNCVI